MIEEKKLSVLMVTGVYPPDRNGAALQSSLIIDLLRKRVNFRVLTSPPSNPSRPRTDPTIYGYIKFDSFINILFSIISIFCLLRNFNPDIIHFHGFSRKVFLIALLGKRLGAKLVLKHTSQGVDDLDTLVRKGPFHRSILRLFDAFVAPSPALLSKGCIPRHYRFNARCVLIPNGVDTYRFSPVSNDEKAALRRSFGVPQDSFLLLAVGHCSLDKRLDDVVEAAIYLSNHSATFTVVLIGSRDSKQFEVSELALSKIQSYERRIDLPISLRCVQFTDTIEKYFQASDLFVLSSSREGLPNVLIEAMSCGVPVISTLLPGITDWIVDDGVDGLLYNVADINQLSRAIAHLRSSPDLACKFSKASRKKIVRRFSASAMADAYFSLYQSLAESR